MDIYASDEEKGEEIKQWWRDNGISVIAACILGAAVVFGGRYWLTYQHTQAASASVHYQHVISLLAEDQFTAAESTTQQLLNEFAKTPYAVFVAFEMAKQSMVNDDLAATKSYLDWIMLNAKLSGQVEIARLRLAQCLVSETKYQTALDLIEQSEAISFEALFSELRGDIHVAQSELLKARAAYQSALLSLKQGEPRQQLLQLKLNDLTGV